MVEVTGKNWSGKIYGQCPVQGFGLVDGYPWYFRARWETWSMEISNDKDIDCKCLPLVGFEIGGWIFEEDWGKEFDAGYMDSSTVINLIEKAILLFREGKLTSIPPLPSYC